MLPRFVVLGKSPADNAYKAVVEHSFSMDVSAERCLIFWSSEEARSPMLEGIAAAFSGGEPKPITFKVDGRKEAEHYRDHFNKNRADGSTFEVHDADDPNLPIVIDWDSWDRDNEPVSNTLSGVRDKFKARNAPFTMR